MERMKDLVHHRYLENEHDGLLLWCKINLQWGSKRDFLALDEGMPNIFYSVSKNTEKDDLLTAY